VAGGFLRKWFGKNATPSQEVEEAQADLMRLAKDRPTLQEPIKLLLGLLPHCAPVTPRNLPCLETERAKAKLVEGVPLLRGENWSPDVQELRRRWFALCIAMDVDPDDEDNGVALDYAVRNNRLDLTALVQDILAGRAAEIPYTLNSLSLDSGRGSTALRLTLFPLLTSVNAALAPLREGVHWQRGFCPTCGSWPLLGEFRGLEQTRFMRCGLCASEWEMPRSICVFCGNWDYNQLGFLHVEGEETSYRAATCDVCHGYVKMMCSLSALPPLQLLVADVATLHLDLIAAERGYSNPPI
jgi:FdhE protein